MPILFHFFHEFKTFSLPSSMSREVWKLLGSLEQGAQAHHQCEIQKLNKPRDRVPRGLSPHLIHAISNSHPPWPSRFCFIFRFCWFQRHLLLPLIFTSLLFPFRRSQYIWRASTKIWNFNFLVCRVTDRISLLRCLIVVSTLLASRWIYSPYEYNASADSRWLCSVAKRDLQKSSPTAG